MSAALAFLDQLTLGQPQVVHTLSLYPLLAEGPAEAGYRILDEALASGCARITEISEGGSVPELRFKNDCELPVLLLDGEELVGAKQNRILNLTLLVGAHQEVVIPVSCVEAGRWSARSEAFSSSDRALYSSGRARKMADVSFSMACEGERRSDQHAVWEDIAEKSERLRAPSPTGAAAALYETHREHLDAYLAGLNPIERQCGALFAIGKGVVGLDLFDSPEPLRKLLPKLVRSYALDAIDRSGEGGGAKEETVRGFLHSVKQANAQRFPALGLGEDVRLNSAEITGAALEVGDRLIHLCAFRRQSQSHSGSREGRMARASERRRRFE